MKNKLIIITGTPGVGKSSLAKKLSKKLKYKRVDLHNHYKSISTSYNNKKQCYDVDLKKLIGLITELKKKESFILDSHISHLLPKRLVDLCLVLVCPDLKKLERRLKKRKYPKSKIQENLGAEIFQICLVEAKNKWDDVQVVDVTKDSFIEVVKRIKN
jgi:adenylate kinase